MKSLSNIKGLVLSLFVIFSFIGHAQMDKEKLNELYTQFKTAKNDTLKIRSQLNIVEYLMEVDTIAGNNELNKVVYKLKHHNDLPFVFRSFERVGKICQTNDLIGKARSLYHTGLSLSQEKKLPFWSSVFYYRLADIFMREDLSKQSLPYFDSAIVFANKKNEKFLAKLNSQKGRSYYDIGDYKSAMDYYIIAQKLYEKNNLLNDEYGRLLHFIGSVFKRQRSYDKALEYYEKELNLAKEIKSKSLEAEALYLCASMYGQMGDSDKDLQYLLKALGIYREENNTKSIALMLGNISNNYADRNDYKKAVEYGEQSLAIYLQSNEKEKLVATFGDLGMYHSKLKQYKKALEYFNKALEMNEKVETKHLLNKKDITRYVAYTMADMGDYRSAFNKYLEYRVLEDSLNNLDNKMYLSDLEKKYDTEKKEKEIDLLNKDKQMHQSELAKQATQRNALILGISLVMIIAAISIIAFVNNRKKSKLLSMQVNEINYQNSVIKEKNKDITDSIVYAKRLQEAVFPSTNELNNYFAESFVLFRPKDIVSGDFYWFEQIGDKTIFIVGDSTGHGVPGAFMSILGHNLLNQIILEEKITEPCEILSLLDKRVTSALNKKGSKQEYNDGMDIGVCVINKNTNKLVYAGANRPLIIKRGETIFDLKQNKFAIGGITTSEAKVFLQHEMVTQKDDALYLFSDGYYDQFGGPKGKKFKFKQLQELLLANAHKPMAEQMVLLNSSFENWMGNLEQIDDVCIVGVKI